MRLTDRIHLVASGRLGFQLTDDYDCHVYLVDGGSELALIDAGGGRSTHEIVQNVRAAGLDPARLRHLLLTHAHGDHAAGAAGLRAALGLAVRMSAVSAPWLRAGDESKISLDIAKETGMYPRDFAFPPCPVETDLRDEDTIRVGEVTLRTIDTPGHSAGHVSFLLEADGRHDLFVGDALFYGGRVVLQHTWDCSVQETCRTVERLAEHRVDGFFPGHLTFSLREGDAHVQAALAYVRRLAVPPPLVV